MTTPIDKDYVCVIDQGQKKPISPITHTKTVWDEEKQKYIDSIIKDLEYTVGLPVTTSLDITEEGKYALDAVAGHRLNEICEKVFQSADNARNYFARIVGIDNPENYNLTTLANKVREYMNELGKAINEKGGNCPTDPTFPDLISCLRNAKYTIKEYEYTFWLSYNDLAKSWKNNKNGSGIMEHYEPWDSNKDHNKTYDSQRNFIICLSDNMIMQLSEKYNFPSGEIILSQFLYPYWETNYAKDYPTEHYKYIIRHYDDSFYEIFNGYTGVYSPCRSVEETFNSNLGYQKVNKVEQRHLYHRAYDDNNSWDGFSYEGKRYYAPLNAFGNIDAPIDCYNSDLLYVRLKADNIKSYWSYFLYSNDLNTKNYEKKDINRLKDIRGYDTVFNMKIGVPFTLRLLARE